MSVGSILFALAMVIAVVLFLARPIILSRSQQRSPQSAAGPDEGRSSSLNEHKEALLYQIRMLDFEHETGTVPEEFYQTERATLIAATAETLRQLDSLALPSQSLSAEEPEAGQMRRDDALIGEIEAAVAALRGQRGADGRSAGYCPQCGQALDPDDKFCARCGADVRAVVALSAPRI
jgi:hypothetical protein